MAIAGLGYVFDSLAAVLGLEIAEVSTITFAGEVLLALWLLTRSRYVGLLDDSPPTPGATPS